MWKDFFRSCVGQEAEKEKEEDGIRGQEVKENK
jgi:hypothetical protein